MFSKFIILPEKQQDISCINHYIFDILSNINIPSYVLDIILHTGKRIRTLLALEIYYRYHRTVPKNLYKILALVELIHFASLLHDDVIDNGTVRRGKSSVYKVYGAKKTILLGDYLLAKIFSEISKLPTEKYVIDRFIKVATDTAYGAYLEQNLLPSATLQDYIKMVSMKTASLFQFATTVGIWHLDNVPKIGTFATCFGIIYQVQNDINDYRHQAFHDSEDYMQGNITYPVIVLYKKYSDLFTNKNQQNFATIQGIIQSKTFKQRSYSQLFPYLKRLTDTDIYVK